MKSTQQAQQAIEKLNAEIIRQMQEVGTDWIKPWRNKMAKGLPHNYFGKRNYNGINLWLLLYGEIDYTSTAWGTKKQWEKAGFTELKGEPMLITLTKPTTSSKYKDKKGNPLKYWLQRHYYVYNSEQVTGFELPEGYDSAQIVDSYETNDADQLVINSGVTIKSDTRAYFHPSMDFIGMPDRDTFTDSESYYGTLLHELTHWTGHKDRLNRKQEAHSNDREAYAFEELIAEFGAAQLCAITGISPSPREDHAKYLNSWIRALSESEKVLPMAMAMASKSCTYLLGLKQEGEQQQAA